MFSPTRALLRAISKARICTPTRPRNLRLLSHTPAMSSSDAPPSKPGQFAQTDSSITTEYPEKLPSSTPVRRTKRTLASFSLEGKTAIITGGARGLGYVMTQALVESGADVAIVDLNWEEATKSAERLLTQFKSENPDAEKLPKITAHRADVAIPASVEETFDEILREHGGYVDTLVTSAGLCENFPAEQYPATRLQHIMNVNVNGTYFFAAALARHLIEKKQKGSMIFIGSMSGSIVNIPQPQAPYNASKAAVRHLASSFAVEWAKHKIRVNCISPGYMLTDLTKRILEERPELGETWRSLTPMGRMGDPQDLMGAVVYLASDAAGFVTGAELKVDGGYTVT